MKKTVSDLDIGDWFIDWIGPDQRIEINEKVRHPSTVIILNYRRTMNVGSEYSLFILVTPAIKYLIRNSSIKLYEY